MKSYEDFKEFYSEELFAELLEMDGIRKAMLIKCTFATVLLLGLTGLTSLLLSTEQSETVLWVLVAWILCIGLWCIAIWYFTRYYRGNFKHLVIDKLVEFIDPNLSYAPEGSIPEYIFRRAEIFERYVNTFEGEDLICGTIGKTHIRFSEINAQYQEENEDTLWTSIMSSDSLIETLMNKYKHTIFKGLFFEADFHKSFHGQVLVMPDKAEKYFGRFGSMLQSYNFIRGELMKMDNAEFEKDFVVYGSDQIQARYVLSPRILGKIVELKKKAGSALFLSFKNSMLYIAIPCKENKFEPPYFKSLIDYMATFRYFQDLALFIGIVDEFNLNTRIWTKE
ncbi:MAG: DUF3137 domain-containing protein [Planctomycetota bacterium]